MPLADAFTQILGPQAQVRVSAYDGSSAGPLDAPATWRISSPRALAYLAHSREPLVGLARAYVAGDMDVHGDMYTAVRALYQVLPLTVGDRTVIARAIMADPAARAAVLRRPPRPPREMPYRRLFQHTKRRDAQAIAYHYDVSNRFWERLLGPAMSYSCALFPEPEATLEQAQRHKFDLVASELELRAGMRVLDVGCGWGTLLIHLAQRHQITAVGVTLSAEQAAWARQAVDKAGVGDQVTILHRDYRDLDQQDFDAIVSLEMNEHVGLSHLSSHYRLLHGKLKPAGRMLLQSITLHDNAAPPPSYNAVAMRFVFPDGALPGPGRLISSLTAAGFEIVHTHNQRNHYPKTLAAWSRKLDEHWDQITDDIGEPAARTWRFYMAAARVGMEANLLQNHRILAVKPDPTGANHLPLHLQTGTGQKPVAG